MTIASVTERWPDTARIFARYGLGCASCAISKSETVLQGATGHGGGRVKVDDLLRDLNTFASTGKLPDGLREKPGVAGPNTLKPSVSRGGIPIMSMNLLLPGEEEAVIWRGPMVSGAIRQFFSDVAWGELDFLIVDLPPGTSDAPLTVMQALPVSGVVLVTTPQALATMVVTKAVRLVKQLGGDILGVVENMAYVAMPDGSRNEVFGPSQGLKLVIASNAPLIAKLPIDPEIARLSDAGLIESYESPESEELIVNFLERAPEKHQQVLVA